MCKPSPEGRKSDFDVCKASPEARGSLQTITEDNLDKISYPFINNKDNFLQMNYLIAKREDNISIRNYPLLLKKDNFLPRSYLITNIICNFAPESRLR